MQIKREEYIKNLILKMDVNGSGIRDTARVLGINPTTVINTLKKAEQRIENVNEKLLQKSAKEGIEIDIVPIDAMEVELDEMWSFVGDRSIKMHNIVIGLLINVLDFELLL